MCTNITEGLYLLQGYSHLNRFKSYQIYSMNAGSISYCRISVAAIVIELSRLFLNYVESCHGATHKLNRPGGSTIKTHLSVTEYLV